MICYKTVSAGNDFLHINTEDIKGARDTAGRPSKGRLAEMLCRRHTGAGADGVIFYTLKKESVGFDIFNRDGSRAELSGNGMAGLSALMFHLGKFENQITLDTLTGPKTHHLLERDKYGFRINIEIGEPDFNNTAFFPFLEKGKDNYHCGDTVFYPVSTGNPHVVILSDHEPAADVLERRGAEMENHPMFPQKTNVEWVFFENETDCRVYYYERGVGPTVSSSTGSAAVFAVLQKCGRILDQLTINTPEGPVKIYGSSSIYIESYTKIVYNCIYYLA